MQLFIETMAELFDDEQGDKFDLKINKKYASEYQSRKQKEELRRVQFDEDVEDESSSDESEDEDGELLTTKLDADIMKTLNAVRSKDTRIYDPKVRFFQHEETSENGMDDTVDDKQTKSTKIPKKTYKDVMREQILEQIEKQEAGDQNDVDDENEESHRQSGALSKFAYDKEQQELRKAFMQYNNNDDEDSQRSSSDDLLIVKSRMRAEESTNEDSEEARKALEAELQRAEASLAHQPLDLVDPKGEVKDASKFLLEYFKNRSWVDRSDYHGDSEEPDIAAQKDRKGDSDDESLEQLEEMDQFEAKYNFRFEEATEANESGAAFSNISYARGLTVNTLRRKDESRREKRLAKKDKKEEERRAKEEQLKRLKNAKRQELESKLQQIKEVIGDAEDGAVDEATLMKLLDGDFDPEKFEELMAQAYNDDFYNKQDPEWVKDTDVRQSLVKDEDGDLLVGQDEVDGGLYDNVDDAGDDDQEFYEPHDDGEDYWDEEEQDEEPRSEIEKKLKAKVEDELYKLDYEDIVAGQPTRFKYRKVEPNSYGLSTEEILFSRDATLKQFVSLKQMAPYREEEEFHVNAKKRRRFRELLKKELEEQALENAPQKSLESEPVDDSNAKKKRRRLKKDKDGTVVKPESAPETETVDTATLEENAVPSLDIKEKGSKRRKEKRSNMVAQGDGSERAKDKKKRKRSKSKVEGVTDTRLASYGI